MLLRKVFPEQRIDFTRYDVKVEEPVFGSTRNWTLYGEINQKRTRQQDEPVCVDQLTDIQKEVICSYYPEGFD